MQKLPANWDDQQRALNGHVLQGHVWATFQDKIGRTSHHANSSYYSWVGFERRSRGLKYLALPYGPTIVENPANAYQSVIEAATKCGYDFVRIEPVGSEDVASLKAIGAHKIADVEPQFTQIIDLKKPEEELRADLESGHRNRINTAPKRGVEVYSSDSLDEIDDFLELMHDTAKNAGITNHPDKYYKDMAEMMIPAGTAKFYVATAEGKKVTISLIYDYHGTRYYAHTGSNQVLNRKYNAGVFLVWQMILDAKAEGYGKFDMWGVAPPESGKEHKWAGISAFKRGFGGDTIGTLGTWDIPLKKSKYSAYKLYRKLRKMDV